MNIGVFILFEIVYQTLHLLPFAVLGLGADYVLPGEGLEDYPLVIGIVALGVLLAFYTASRRATPPPVPPGGGFSPLRWAHDRQPTCTST